MKLFKTLLVLVAAFAVSAVAHAETQAVKVSGDLTTRAFARNNYDLTSETDQTSELVSSNWSTFLTSTAEVQVDADLTDNVAAVVRLVNQRVWGNHDYSYEGTSRDSRGSFTSDTQEATTGDAFNVDMDLAYVELRDFMYSPVTLRIGRQDLWFGRGFIVGNSLMNPNNALPTPEYTAINSFDALRATMDLDPWTIDAVYAKVAENALQSDNDVNLMGLNVGYLFDTHNAEAETYYWWKRDRNPHPDGPMDIAGSRSNNDVHVLGLRGSFDPIEDWTVAVEGAYQTGKAMNTTTGQDGKRTRSAWATDLMIETRHFQDMHDWKPVLSADYIWYSGERNMLDQGANDSSSYKAWDPMFRGKFNTAIRDFQNWMYGTSASANTTPSYMNQHQLIFGGSVEPTADMMLSAQYANFWTSSKVGSGVGHSHIGQELDLELLWDYTEDVQFGLLAAWFFPGSHLDEAAKEAGGRANKTATSLVGTVSLSF